LEALLASITLVALAEIGDKTQLLSFVLAAKLRRPYAIIAGIFVATLANHALAGRGTGPPTHDANFIARGPYPPRLLIA
jgi:putative Ca2+/H+ antiporter (TMEM165/GDT1 family)